ncbi:serine/threonine-protein phosphatase 4 regulatory subunit 4-like isoform X2 [Gigantopelta aegis]|uniref:serine/threonine-protein phosphatase 4 regulatory subunit 4-like isoform X2 n=1 Tax=Gigantopelta aegis TaxID=1735272 RepID=UPI001B887414|nr:serine/threonine-protein phosphatase 4 regulatory subunit 4-like isoform X2 [Gigantopelta aegis]
MDTTPPSLAEDLAELLAEKTILKALKTVEELDQLTVDEKLNDIERAVYLLSSSGQEVQRISVITNLPDLLQNNHAECMRRVVPKVREVLYVAQSEMQVAASSAFLQILQRELVPIQNYTQTFLQTILLSVDSKDPEVAKCWLDTLLDVIELLPKDVIKSDILSIAISKGQLSQAVQSRLSCCKILGKIATKFEPFVIKKEILPVVQSLCQDVDYEVRGCMCYQLDAVARGLGLESTKSAILPELVELTNDEESYVRIAGLETVVNILSLLDDDTCSTTIIPLVCKFCQQANQAQDSTLPAIAKQLGRICHELSRTLTDDEKELFVDYYRKFSRIGRSEKAKNTKEAEKESPPKVFFIPEYLVEEDSSVECRKNCAFNFPAMVLFVGAKHFKSSLYSTLVSLCTDPSIVVRKTISTGFHEVAKSLGSYVNMVQPELVTLLKDESVEVLQGVITYLPETLSAIANSSTNTAIDSKLQAVSDIIPVIIDAERVISTSNNWRLQEVLMTNLACLTDCCSNDVICSKVIPMLFEKLKKGRALPVRHAAARTVLLLLRNLKKLEQREALIHKFINEFCHGNSCHRRNLFIDICKFVLEYYSKTFFKDYFFEPVLELTSDPVPNIRLRMCSILPDLKRLVKIPNDRNLVQLLDSSVRKIFISEKDRDVNAALKKAAEMLDKTPVQMDSVLNRHKTTEDDIDDNQKEEHEKRLLIEEEREKKMEEEKIQAKAEKKIISTKKGDNCSSKIPAPKRGGGKSSAHAVKDTKKAAGLSVSSGTAIGSMKAPNPSSKTMVKASLGKGNHASLGSGLRKSSATTHSNVTARRGSTTSASSTNSSTSSVFSPRCVFLDKITSPHPQVLTVFFQILQTTCIIPNRKSPEAAMESVAQWGNHLSEECLKVWFISHNMSAQQVFVFVSFSVHIYLTYIWIAERSLRHQRLLCFCMNSSTEFRSFVHHVHTCVHAE